ncbi:hypothetical protein A3A46_03745 [Candidatus Roizmanbacteria bacterium RIFCSPLOWO2_01_FULL_37_13]|uniref:Uncharacterized protein n=1 Tax=Candidatus Roizmanbacteria bacterium RIFCSPHIGHO2_02_FULL_38_11 TaxID=1802039 RepID=A0A1F7H1Z5_9BACT|nr:MAG: hypothetical protein A3C25_00525 [Candidatus Roizmanbacteria bacterium RIFCSPHIGHO2_02_FULL_38_11]OGK41036.1 MAG: hypothetical protein A3A46_03745 [Candidatus Roizmanbacteria bacterium RIFCSPLOWO2_01_FULL_37_13]
MEKDVANYIRKHTFSVMVVIITAFLLLAFGEFFLYRKTQELNKMISEGMMQIKEELKTQPESLDEIILQEEKKLEETEK